MIAGLHGINLNDTIASEREKPKTNSEPFLAFQDPRKYRNLSKEKKEELTKKMTTQHKNWSANKM